MRAGGDRRGSAQQRRKRKQQLLDLFGDGHSCGCSHCGCRLTFKTLEQDRIIPGGSYNLHNLQPSCGLCNKRRSNNKNWRYVACPT